MRYAFYVLWRLLRLALLTVTAPIWVPTVVLLYFIFTACLAIVEWFEDVDYEYKAGITTAHALGTAPRAALPLATSSTESASSALRRQ